MVYRFAGEVVDVDAVLAAGRAAGPGKTVKRARPVAGSAKVDKETGEMKGDAERR
jgi:hypothetical protein